MLVVALCKRLRDADRLAAEVDAVDGVDLAVLVTRTHARWLHLGGVVADVLREGPRGWVTTARRLARGRLRITMHALGDDAVLRHLRALDPDVGLHATPVIYRRAVLDCFRLGVLNAHIGMLPRYRGRSVMEWSILNGDPTGITTFFLDEGIDTGPRMVVRHEVPVTGFPDLDAAKEHLFSLAPREHAAALRELQRPGFEPMLQQIADGTRWYAMSSLFTGVAEELHRRPDASREALIAGALRQRLAEVPETTAGVSHDDVDAGDREELLRVLMVRLWPRVADATATPEQRRAFFAHLHALADGADDVRVLDAFNCAYEAIGDGDAGDPLAAGFLETYRAVLRRRAASSIEAAA